MAYVVEPSSEHPHFIFGEWMDFEMKVPDINERSEVARIFKTGRRELSLCVFHYLIIQLCLVLS